MKNLNVQKEQNVLVKRLNVFRVEEKKKPERFRNNVPSSSPAKVNNSGDEDMDVAAKMEDAYGNLNKMLGDGAMASMATETKKLVAQQQELNEYIKFYDTIIK